MIKGDILKGKVSPFQQTIHKWRARRDIPFRTKFFIGYDLQGNTYWELKNHNNPGRMRRIIEPQDSRINLCDYKPAPQWMQWLRFARPSAPTLEELISDQMRQARLKGLVAAADLRWKSVPLKDTTETQATEQIGTTQASQEHTKEQEERSQEAKPKGRTAAQPIVDKRE